MKAQRESAEIIAKPLFTIYQHSWPTKEVPEDWSLANMTSIYKRGCKEDVENYRLVSLTSVPGKAMEQTVLRKNPEHLENTLRHRV